MTLFLTYDLNVRFEVLSICVIHEQNLSLLIRLLSQTMNAVVISRYMNQT